MFSILEGLKFALVGQKIKIYIHRMTSPIPLKASPMEWDMIDLESPSENYLIRTILDIEYVRGDYDRWDECKIVFDKPIMINGQEISDLPVSYTTKFDLEHV